MAAKKSSTRSVSLKIGTHKSRSGGLTAAGRRKYNRATGSNLKAPQPEGGPRKRSFCARMSVKYLLLALGGSGMLSVVIPSRMNASNVKNKFVSPCAI